MILSGDIVTVIGRVESFILDSFKSNEEAMEFYPTWSIAHAPTDTSRPRRALIERPLDQPIRCLAIGKSFRFVGYIQYAAKENDGDPPHLSVVETVPVWIVMESSVGGCRYLKPFLVFERHIIAI